MYQPVKQLNHQIADKHQCIITYKLTVEADPQSQLLWIESKGGDKYNSFEVEQAVSFFLHQN